MKYLFLILSCACMASCEKNKCETCVETLTSSNTNDTQYPLEQRRFEACGDELEIDGAYDWWSDGADTIFLNVECN